MWRPYLPTWEDCMVFYGVIVMQQFLWGSVIFQSNNTEKQYSKLYLFSEAQIDTCFLYLQGHVWIQILNSDSRKQQRRPKTLPAAFLCVFCSVFGSNFSPHYNEPLQCITKARVMCRSISRGHCWIYFWCQKAECCHTAQDCKKLIIWVRFKFKLENNTNGDIL